jgi:hypothetical protein
MAGSNLSLKAANEGPQPSNGSRAEPATDRSIWAENAPREGPDSSAQIDGAACPTAVTDCSGLANAVVRYGVLVGRCLSGIADSA